MRPTARRLYSPFFNKGGHLNSNFRKGGDKGKPNYGAMTPRDMGDPFTSPSVYRNTSDASIQAKLPKKIRQLRTEESLRRHMGSQMSDKELMELERSGGRQRSEDGRIEDDDGSDVNARVVSSGMLNRRDLGLGEFQPRVGRGGITHNTGRVNRGDVDVDVNVMRAVQAPERFREMMEMRHPQAPNSKEYHKLFRQHLDDGKSDDVVVRHQSRLVEENGIYPTKRIDAYMLDDDASVFPQWVNELHHSVRDRVKYGNMGLTEEDEALRVRLGRLPMDQRMREWDRLKKARSYLAAKEEKVSPTELRNAREGNRRFHWLQRKRQQRATALRKLALRKPDQFNVWPTDAVDYSRRLGVIAQHVENGVATHGQWPLDEEELAKVKLRRRQETAERTFLQSASERKLARGAGMSGNIARTISEMDSQRAPATFKRLSTKVYANRVNAVKHGDQDVHGRKYHHLARQSKSIQKAFGSIAEMAMHNELRKEPRVNVKGSKQKVNQHWEHHQQDASYTFGMPNNRFGA